MNKTVKLLNQYVADLNVMNTKLHNLHWNVVGKSFKQVHVFLEELYEDLFEKFDEAAERIKMMENYPLASVKDYLALTRINELESKDVSIQDSFEIVLEDFNYLKSLAMDIRKVADEAGDFGTVMILEDHIASYDKVLYFIRQSLK